MARVHTLAVVVVLAAVAAAGANGTPGTTSLARLKDGNARTAGARDVAPSRAAGAGAPYAAVLSCADARVPPESVFGAAPGDLFVVRALGHVADRAMLASLEYAAEGLQVPLLVVMGHESCAVVTSATAPQNGSSPAGLDYFLKAIGPAAARVAGEPAATRVRAAILAHVEETINQLLEASAVLRRRAEGHQLTIAGAYYELGTGRVHFSEPVRVPPRITTRAASPAPPSGAKPVPPAAQGAGR